MSTFTPPTDDVVPPIYIGDDTGRDLPSHYADVPRAMHRLMLHYAQRPRGRNVFLMMDGAITEDQPPNWNPVDPTGPFWSGWNPLTHQLDSSTLPTSQQVRKVFWGGTANPVTAAEAALLTAAGYTIT